MYKKCLKCGKISHLPGSKSCSACGTPLAISDEDAHEDKYRYFSLVQCVEHAREEFGQRIQELKKKENKTEEDVSKLRIDETAIKLLDGMDNIDIEDWAVYKDYLKKFHLESLYEGFEFRIDPDLHATQADIDVFLRFVFGSFTSNYNLEFDKNTNQVLLPITVVSKGIISTKKLDELFDLVFDRLFIIYFNEQVRTEADGLTSEKKKVLVDKEREGKLLLFERKMRRLQANKEGYEIEEDKYFYFCLQQLVKERREMLEAITEELSNKENKTKDEKDRLRQLEAIKAALVCIADNMDIEDLPFYRNYLKYFDVQHLLKDYELSMIQDSEATPADIDVLLRFVLGSDDSKYDLVFDKDGKQVKLLLFLKPTSKHFNCTFDALDSYQIRTLLAFFFYEHVMMEVRHGFSDWDRTYVDNLRKQKLQLFDRKIRKLQDYKESLAVIDAIDDLLNS